MLGCQVQMRVIVRICRLVAYPIELFDDFLNVLAGQVFCAYTRIRVELCIVYQTKDNQWIFACTTNKHWAVYLWIAHVAQVSRQACSQRKDHGGLALVGLSDLSQLIQPSFYKFMIIVRRCRFSFPAIRAIHFVQFGCCLAPCVVGGCCLEQMLIVGSGMADAAASASGHNAIVNLHCRWDHSSAQLPTCLCAGSPTFGHNRVDASFGLSMYNWVQASKGIKKKRKERKRENNEKKKKSFICLNSSMAFTCKSVASWPFVVARRQAIF